MKIRFLMIMCMNLYTTVLLAQVFSNGFNTITGSNTGIGTSSPIWNLHLRASGNAYSVVQSDALNSTAAIRIQDASGNNNELALSKFGPNVTGNFMGISRSNMSVINSLTGPFVLNAGGRMIFGTSMTVSPFTQIPRFFIDSFARVHVGTSTDNIIIGSTTIAPAEKLHVIGGAQTGGIRITNTSTGHTNNDGIQITTTGTAASITNLENANLDFGTNGTSRMRILSNGNVQIGTTSTPAGYKLYVETGILTEKIKVALKSSSNWSDFVFADNYTLQALPEVEKYIKQHKHLPGIPSAEELVGSGIDVVEMDAKLLQKIEELTLHVIRLEKEINALKSKQQRQSYKKNN